jgi:hypothetical protein
MGDSRQAQNQVPQRASSTATSSPVCARSTNHSENPILDLQGTIGNQAVLRLLRAQSHGSQAGSTLTVNSPGDVYEQEADRVSDHIMRTSAQTGGSMSGSAPVVQLKARNSASAGGMEAPPSVRKTA